MYRQTGAAWTVRFTVAVELFLALTVNASSTGEPRPSSNTSTLIPEIKRILRSDARRSHTVTAASEDINDDHEKDAINEEGITPSPLSPEAVSAVFMVRDAMRSAVEAYVDLVGESTPADFDEEEEEEEEAAGTDDVGRVSKAGRRSSKNGIFFLVSRPDDLPVLTTLKEPSTAVVAEPTSVETRTMTTDEGAVDTSEPSVEGSTEIHVSSSKSIPDRNDAESVTNEQEIHSGKIRNTRR